MKLQKHLLYIAIAAVTAFAGTTPASAATTKELLKVTDIKIGRMGDDLSISIDINPRAVNPGRDKEIVFTPVVIADNGDERLPLPSITVAGRNRYYSHIRNNDLPKDANIWAAGSRETIKYHQEVPFEDWMNKCHIVMDESVGNCCDTPTPVGNTPMAKLDLAKPVFQPAQSFVALTGDEKIERTAEGRAFVDFIVNRTNIDIKYRKNREEIGKILASIKVIKDDPDAIITRITIKGYASPEGPYDNNVRLAMGRTQALKEYVRNEYNFDPEIMFTDFEPEDWEGLRNFLDTCTLTHRKEILDITNSNLAPDPKDNAIKAAFPAEYKIIKDSIYPALRHSDYTIKYNFREFVNIDELKKVYATHPDRLRPVDFQRIAGTFDEGSPEWEEVYMTAAKMHPADEKSNINAANIAIKHGQAAEAADLLSRAGDSAEAIFTRGQLAAVTGDLNRAADLFHNAAELGLESAEAEQKRVEEIINRPIVEYLIEPTK